MGHPMQQSIAKPATLAAYLIPIACLALALGLNAAEFEPYQSTVAASTILGIFAIVLVLSTVFVALHHAEAIAHRVGQPYGTLILTFAVTALEVSIIVSMMLNGANNPTLARESVFSTVMIVCGGVVGICLTLGAWRHSVQDINRQGTSAFLAVLIALTILTMVLPSYTVEGAPGGFSTGQLVFVSLVSVSLYGSFVYAQAFDQQGHFVAESARERKEREHSESSTSLATHVVMLIIGLAGIILLTERIAVGVEDGLHHFQIQQSDTIVGAMIALVVLLPEALAAIRAAMRNDLQRGLNIALGSACATIGLTIPAVAMASLFTGRSLTLGLEPDNTVLLVLALLISMVSFGTGRTTVLTGFTHLAVFLAFILLIFAP
jgi:Ca2+:H+ antiporter